MTVATDDAATQKAAADQKAADDKAAADKKTADDKATADTKAAADAKTAADEKAAADKKTADEKKAADEKAAAGGTDGKGKPEPKAPAKYALKLPDAQSHHVDDRYLAKLEEIARASDWTNEEAQAALDEQLTYAEAQSVAFLDETKADKTYGGDHLTQTQKLAQSVITAVRPEGHPRRDAFLRFLNRGGAGNNVEVLAFLADLGKKIAEDSPAHAGGGGGGGQQDRAATLYDHPDSKAADGRT